MTGIDFSTIARKLACLFYRLLRYGQDYVEQGMTNYEQKYKVRLVYGLKKHAQELGFPLVDNPADQHVT